MTLIFRDRTGRCSLFISYLGSRRARDHRGRGGQRAGGEQGPRQHLSRRPLGPPALRGFRLLPPRVPAQWRPRRGGRAQAAASCVSGLRRGGRGADRSEVGVSVLLSAFPAVPEAWGLGRAPRRVPGCLLLGGRGTSREDACLPFCISGASVLGLHAEAPFLLGGCSWGEGAAVLGGLLRPGARELVSSVCCFSRCPAPLPPPAPNLPQMLSVPATLGSQSFRTVKCCVVLPFGAQVAALFPDALKAVSDTSWQRVSGAGHAPRRCWQ